MSISVLNKMNNKICSCGKIHSMPIDRIIVGKGAISQIPEIVKGYNAKKAFLISDLNTQMVAGKKVCEILVAGGIDFTNYVIEEEMPDPDEINVGRVILNYDVSCDIIIGIGSGVINDISKIISTVAQKPYIIVGTAPSMDGYASSISSMIRSGMKVSIPSKMAEVIIGDTDILKTAPDNMLLAGLGDMVAKYVSLCEWKISNIINGEYYCEQIADLVRTALERCLNNAKGLLAREDEALSAVFEGLVICGAAMTYAGLSRPASGIEHYMSHIWDMRGVEFGDHIDLHGTQCAVGTLISIKLYSKLKSVVPNEQKALEYANKFDYDDWSKKLTEFLGHSADAMIILEKKEGKYDKEKHASRIKRIIDHWAHIRNVVVNDLPEYDDLVSLYRSINMPISLEDIGIDQGILKMTFLSTKDIRNKYVLSHLAWDLGILDELAEGL